MHCKLVKIAPVDEQPGTIDFRCVNCGKTVSFNRSFFSDTCNENIEECEKYAINCQVSEDRNAPPPITTRINNYLKAVKRWIAAGCPTRTDEEVVKIFETYCARCKYFDKENSRCNTCGCNLSSEEKGILAQLKSVGVNAMMNKIRMKTEYCTIGLWGEDPLKNDET
jgi:hypothetical protein